MSHRRIPSLPVLGLAALAVAPLLGLAGCARRSGANYPEALPWSVAVPVGDMSLDRGGWIVGQQKGIWKVTQEVMGQAPAHLGFVIAREHREVRGGPTFTMYEVTTTDRKDVIGFVDSLGNATRFVTGRNGSVEKVKVGNNRLDLSVAAIFDTVRPVELVATTERALAAEALFASWDKDADGLITRSDDPEKNEFPAQPAQIKRFLAADANRDGKLDRTEFQATLDF